jgi:Fur family ferric uptake transcriptional regulator
MARDSLSESLQTPGHRRFATPAVPPSAVTPPTPIAPAKAPKASSEAVASAGGCQEQEPCSPSNQADGMGSLEDVYRLCRELGMRLSRQRRMVLDLLWAEKSHLSARDIFEKLNNLGRNIGHTSVYQNLEALQSAGVIECLDRASGRLYGYRADPHSHLTCLDTGAIHDLDVVLPAELLSSIERQTGFRITSYTLNLSGRRG